MYLGLKQVFPVMIKLATCHLTCLLVIGYNMSLDRIISYKNIAHKGTSCNLHKFCDISFRAYSYLVSVPECLTPEVTVPVNVGTVFRVESIIFKNLKVDQALYTYLDRACS